MKTCKRIFLLVLLFVTILFLSLFLYRTYHYLATPQITASLMIPNNAALVVKGNKTEHVLDLNKEYQHLLPVLFSLSQEKKINTVLNSILSDDKYKQFIQDASFYLSVHIDDDGEEELLFTLETSRYYNRLLLDFLDLLRMDFNDKSFTYRNNTVYYVQTDNGLLYLHHQNGLLLMTYSENLIRRAINRLLSNDNAMQYVTGALLDARNENTNICLYVQYRYFIPYLKQKVRKAGGNTSDMDLLQSFQWSVFDLTVNKKDILFSGYTTVNVSMKESTLFTHKNNELDISKILPVDANNIFSIKANKADDFRKRQPIVPSAEDFFSFMYPIHIVTFEIENNATEDKFLLIKSENISVAALHLYNSITSSFVDNQYLLDTLHTGSLLVGHVDLPNFVYTQLGISKRLPKLSYYTIIDDYVVFTNKKESMLTYVDALRRNKTLKTAMQYQTLNKYFQKEANLFYCYHFPNTKTENSDNPCFQYYNNSLQVIRAQFYAQSDSILLSSIVFQMK